MRGSLIRAVVAVLLCAVAAFCCKDLLFAVVMAPSRSDFLTYRLFTRLTGFHDDFSVALFNPELAQQFLIHMRISFWTGVVLTSPYLLYLLFRFVSPGLYARERRYLVRAVGGGYLMFLAGIVLNYFILFPFTFRFLGTYQVSPDVPNQIALSSYVGILLTLCLVMGIVFELPVLCWLLAKVGLLKPKFMTRYRRHAIVVILILAAVITPTGDPFTLLIVALPIYLLYEASVLLVRQTERTRERSV